MSYFFSFCSVLMGLCQVRDAASKARHRMEAEAKKGKKLADKEARKQQQQEDRSGICEFY